MKVLNGECVEKLRPEILLVLRLFDDMYLSIGEELEVTWCTGGQHMIGSLHSKRRAFDISIASYNPRWIVERVKVILGVDYDVVLEEACLHVEWDPK